jgi:hypothetical protein
VASINVSTLSPPNSPTSLWEKDLIYQCTIFQPNSLTSLLEIVIVNGSLTFPLLSLTSLLGPLNLPVDNLPQSITHLTFGLCFDFSVDHLPPRLSSLTFQGVFDQRIDHLPSTLSQLTFTYPSNAKKNFNQTIDHLPASLTHLSFHPRSPFNQSIDHLPPSLTKLELGESFHAPINRLPSLSSLVLYSCPKLPLLPPSLTELSLIIHYPQINATLPPLPSSLRKLSIISAPQMPNSLHTSNTSALYPPTLFLPLSLPSFI